MYVSMARMPTLAGRAPAPKRATARTAGDDEKGAAAAAAATAGAAPTTLAERATAELAQRAHMLWTRVADDMTRSAYARFCTVRDKIGTLARCTASGTAAHNPNLVEPQGLTGSVGV